VFSKKFELISPKICRAGEISPTPFRPLCLEVETKGTISSFSLAVN
jgi:hypothetical protein